MQRSRFLFVIITVISLLAACSKRSSGSSDIKLIEPAKITEIKVTVLDLKISGKRLFKTISTPSEIQSLAEFVNGQLLNRSSLKSGIDKMWSVQDRSAVIDIAFYESAKYVGTLGIGYVDKEKYFIEYLEFHDTQCCKSKAAVLSNDQKEKLLTLIGYTEQIIK